MFRASFLLAAALTALAGTSSAVDYSGSFSENFNSLGTTGTALPAGFSLYNGESGTDNATWTAATGIVANGTSGSVASMVLNTSGLTATTTPSANNNNGYNAAASSTNTADRVVATAPTTISGAALNLVLTNTTGAAINSLTLGYTIQRFTSVSTANELPGYQLFVSLNGTTWTNIAAFNPTINGANGTIAVPNTVGSTVVTPTSFNLPSAWAAGSDLSLRWVDDNAQQTSPDQIIGLNDITVVPEPATWMMAALTCCLLVGAVLRPRAARA